MVDFQEGIHVCWTQALCGVSFVIVVGSMPMCMTIRAHVLIIDVYISVSWEQFQFSMEPKFHVVRLHLLFKYAMCVMLFFCVL